VKCLKRGFSLIFAPGSDMKFPQLPIGTLFEYDGEVYVKSGPMVANLKSGGGSKMIPRWADVVPHAAPSVEKPVAKPSIDHARAEAALASLHARAEGLLTEACQDLDRLSFLRQELARAHARCLESLDE